MGTGTDVLSLMAQRVPVPCDSQRSLERNRPIPHTTRGRDRRQEGRECGYYYLHRHLNDPFLHTHLLFFRLLYSWRRSAAHWGLTQM